MDKEIDQLNKQAMELYDQGNLRAAISRCKQACRLVREKHRDSEPIAAKIFNNLGMMYTYNSEYTLAEPLLKESLEINRKLYGDDNYETGLSLSNLAELHGLMGDLSSAEAIYRSALSKLPENVANQMVDEFFSSTISKLCGKDVNDAGENIRKLYLLIKETQDLRDHGLFIEAIELLKKNRVLIDNKYYKNTSKHANYKNTIGVFYRDIGSYAQAEKSFLEALLICNKTLGEKHSLTAAVMNNLGELYRDIGDYDDAESYFVKALNVAEDVLGSNHICTAATINNLAILYLMLNNFDRAKRMFEKALEVRKTILGDEDNSIAQSLHNLGLLYRRTGNFRSAGHFFLQSMEMREKVLGANHPNTINSLNSLGGFFSDIGNYKLAETILQGVVNKRQRQLGENHPKTSYSIFNLAIVLARKGQNNQALKLFKQSMFIENEVIGEIFSFASEAQRTAHLKMIKSNLSCFLSLLYRHFNGNDSAVQSALELVFSRKALLAEALATQRDAIFGGQYPSLQGQIEKLSLLRMQITQKTLAGPSKESPEAHRELVKQWNAKKKRLEAELARQIPEMRLEEKLRSADLHAVARKITDNGTLVEFVRFDLFDFKAVPAKGEQTWKAARYLAFVIPAKQPDSVRMIDLGEAEPIDRMIGAFRDDIIAQADQRGEVPAAVATPAMEPPEVTETQRPSLLATVFGRRSPDRAKTHRDLGTLPKQTSAVATERAGSALRKALFDPVIEALGGGTRLLLSPDGDLTRLPFEVLPDANGGRLIDRYNISYVAVGRDLLRFGVETNRVPNAPIVAADPDFDLGAGAPSDRSASSPDDRGDGFDATHSLGRHSRDLDRARFHFERLPGTKTEGERIAELLDVKPWLDANALEAQLKSHPSPAILHLATHGFFLEDQERDLNKEFRDLGAMTLSTDDTMGHFSVHNMENPLLRAGLALAGANTWLRHGTPPEEAEDGLLTAEDVTGLNLLDTELVVLSACETGLGEVRVGEGVFGLRRAFILAGAKTLIMSLWKVPDLATAILMERLYHNLLKRRLPRDEALRQTQNHLRQLTICDMRSQWLSNSAIRKRSANNPSIQDELQQLARQPDDHRPFQHPFYWGAFICQGEPAPLPMKS